jgi:hypothetical protein
MMPVSQQIFALAVCALVFILTFEMVRKRRLREEYSVLWLGTSLVMFILVLKYQWLVALTRFVGAALPTTTLFLGAIVFLMLLGVQFSIKLSRLSDQMKNLAQENALLRAEVERVIKGGGADVQGSAEPVLSCDKAVLTD